MCRARVCKGRRYNRETLEVRYKGKNIYDVLEMTIEEALDFFSVHTRITAKLQTLYDVGLGYVKLGQPSTTLSGGEAQRIKLATELSRRATGRTLYVLDEPTTGLHVADVERLNEVLQRLADAGNTLVIIEHNLDIIKTADYILDIGPEGGDRGGEIIATGTPEEIAQNPISYTGAFLKNFIIVTMTFFSQAAEYRVWGEKSTCQKSFFDKLVDREQAIHNSQWSSCCALAAQYFLARWALRAVSPTGRALRAPPPLPPPPVSAKILRISGRGNCKEADFCSGKWDFPPQKSPIPPYTPPGTILMREGFGPLALSHGFFDSLIFLPGG